MGHEEEQLGQGKHLWQEGHHVRHDRNRWDMRGHMWEMRGSRWDIRVNKWDRRREMRYILWERGTAGSWGDSHE